MRLISVLKDKFDGFIKLNKLYCSQLLQNYRKITQPSSWTHKTDLILCPVVDLLHPAKELDRRPRLLGHVVAQLDVFALHREQLKRTVPRLRAHEITQPISHPFDPHPCRSRLNESWKSPRKMLGPAVSQRKLVPDDDRMTCQNVVRSRPDLLAGIQMAEINAEGIKISNLGSNLSAVLVQVFQQEHD